MGRLGPSKAAIAPATTLRATRYHDFLDGYLFVRESEDRVVQITERAASDVFSGLLIFENEG